MKKALIVPIAFCLLAAAQVDAQEDRSYILQHTNVEKLQQLSSKWAEEYRIKHAEALRMAEIKGWPTEGLQYIDAKGLPVYYTTNNNDAAGQTQTIGLRNTYGVYGAGMHIGIWDGGAVRHTHQELQGRVTIGDTVSFNDHATHVGGTLIASGSYDTDAKGMAPQATLETYDWNNDLTELTDFASEGYLISNHSYGSIVGWDEDDGSVCSGFRKKWTWRGGDGQWNVNGDDEGFGRYGYKAHDIDEVAHNSPFLLIVRSAGNDHNDQPVDDICSDDVRYITAWNDGSPSAWSPYVSFDENIHPSGDGTQRSSIGTWGNAKNILTVGNLKGDNTINEGSSRGMTDDGRIKPDICGKGTDIYSTGSDADDHYRTTSGTSMASPNVAGSLLLLQELYESAQGNSGIYMRSASLKGLAIHTATDLGNPGPDVTYGWGLLNAHAAGNIINEDVAGSGVQTSRIIELPNTNNIINYRFYSDGSPLKVTMCYTDVPGAATTVHNDPNARLVNDLDLLVVWNEPGQGYQIHNPYYLDFNNPTAPCPLGDNDKDNVEQVFLANPAPGLYEVHVNVEGALTGTQPFSLIISGQRNSCQYDLSHGPIGIQPNTYNAQHTIDSKGTVASGNTVIYNGGTSVVLKAGFKAQGNSSFIARNQTCN